MDKDYTPLVPDWRIGQLKVRGLMSEKCREMNYEEGAQDVRAIYEARYKEDAATIAALRAEVVALKVAGNNMMRRIIDRVPNIDIGTDTDLALYNAIHAWADTITTKTD